MIEREDAVGGNTRVGRPLRRYPAGVAGPIKKGEAFDLSLFIFNILLWVLPYFIRSHPPSRRLDADLYGFRRSDYDPRARPS